MRTISRFGLVNWLLVLGAVVLAAAPSLLHDEEARNSPEPVADIAVQLAQGGVVDRRPGPRRHDVTELDVADRLLGLLDLDEPLDAAEPQSLE